MSESTLHSEKGQAAMLNQVMAVLNRIGQTLVAIEDLPETLKEIARSAQEVLGADIVDLYEYVQERNEFVLPPILIGDRRDPFVPKIKIYDDDVVMEAVKLGEPQYFDNAQERALLTSKFKIPRADAPAQRFVIREGVVSSATVPLKAVAKTVGVMFVNYRTRQVFGPEQKNIIESFANLAAIAIHNARLLRLQRERKRQAETLQQVAQTVNSSLSLAEVIDRVLEQLGNVMEYDSASVQLVQGERRTTVGGRGFDIGAVPYELRRNISDDPLISKIVREKRALVLSNVGQEPVWLPIPATAHIQSWIGAPLVFKDQVIGLLMLDHKKAGYYTQESGEVVAAFANQVAAAIRNSAQARALAELNKLSQRLVSIEESPQDTRNLLQQIADSALEILQVDMIDLYEYLQGQCEFKLPQVFAGKKLVEGVPKDKVEQDDVVARLIREERPLYIQSTQTYETFSSPFVVDRQGKPPERFAVREKIQSTAAVPLRTRDETVGLLFANYRTPQEFTTEQRELIELFANQAAIAVRNARWFETRQQLNAQLESQIERLKTLNQVGGALSTRLDTEFIYEAVAKAVVQTLDCTHCTIFVLEHDQLVPHASYGKGGGPPVTRRFARGEGMIGWAIRERRSLLVRDAKKHELFVAGQTRPQVDRSIIVVPIKVGEQVIGAISADQDRINAFDERDRQMVETLALQAGIALQNARRIQDLEIVNNVARDISAQLDTQALFETIVSRIAEQLKCTHCTLFLLQEQDGKLWLAPQKTHGVRPEIMERNFRPDEGLAGWVLQHGESLVLPDVRQDARFAPARKVRESPRSMLVAPVKIGDRTIGVISADQDQFNWFSENGRRLVDTLAQQAAIAIENARLFQQVQQRVDALTLLQEVSAEISTTLNLNETLRLILAGAMRLTRASSGIIRLLDENEQIIEHPFELPEGFKHPAPRFNNPNSMTRRTIDSRQPIVVPDVTQDDRVNPDVAAKGVRSMISLPLKSKEKVVGTLGLNGDRLNQFEESQSLLLTLADQAAIAVENAELYRHISDDLERKIRELEVLTVIGQTVSNLGIDQILDLVYAQAGKIMDLSDAQVQIAFYDEAEDKVTFPLAVEQDDGQLIDRVRWGKREAQYRKAGEAEAVKQLQPRARRVPPGLTEYVIREKKRILIDKDFEQRAQELGIKVWPTFGRLERSTCSWLGVPMIVQDRIVGIISIQSLEQEYAFDQGHLELLYTVASQAAVAIENARLYTDQREKIRALEEAQDKIRQLERIRTMAYLAADFVHGINNMAGTIPIRVQRIREILHNKYPQAKRSLGRHLKGIMDDTQELLTASQRLQNSTQAVQEPTLVNIKDMVDTIVRQVRIQTPLSIQVHDEGVAAELPPVRGVEVELEEAIRDVAQNAVEAMTAKGGRLEISTASRLDSAGKTWVEIEVKDEGPGIPEDVLPKIFGLFYTTKEGGLGYGLWRTKNTVETWGGEITVDSKIGQGTVVHIRLPTEEQ